MGAVYSLVASDWSISAGKVIDYIGDDHGGVSHGYPSSDSVSKGIPGKRRCFRD